MTVLFLGLISLLAVYSSISSLAFKREGGSTLHFLLKHGLMLATGGVIMYYASPSSTPSTRASQLVIGVTAGLLLLTLLLGSNINDASRWITIPIINQSFQTSDLAKVVLIVYLARVLGKHHDREWTFRDVVLQLMVPVGDLWADPARQLLHCGLALPALHDHHVHRSGADETLATDRRRCNRRICSVLVVG
jgi:cell division protein FtsW